MSRHEEDDAFSNHSKIRMVVGLYPFDIEGTNFSFDAGDQMHLLKENPKPGYYEVMNLQTREKALVPKALVVEYGRIENEDWYIGSATWEQIKMILSEKQKPQSFLILKNGDKKFLLGFLDSIKNVKRFDIEINDKGRFHIPEIGEEASFASLPALVWYYKTNNLVQDLKLSEPAIITSHIKRFLKRSTEGAKNNTTIEASNEEMQNSDRMVFGNTDQSLWTNNTLEKIADGLNASETEQVVCNPSLPFEPVEISDDDDDDHKYIQTANEDSRDTLLLEKSRSRISSEMISADASTSIYKKIASTHPNEVESKGKSSLDNNLSPNLKRRTIEEMFRELPLTSASTREEQPPNKQMRIDSYRKQNNIQNKQITFADSGTSEEQSDEELQEKQLSQSETAKKIFSPNLNNTLCDVVSKKTLDIRQNKNSNKNHGLINDILSSEKSGLGPKKKLSSDKTLPSESSPNRPSQEVHAINPSVSTAQHNNIRDEEARFHEASRATSSATDPNLLKKIETLNNQVQRTKRSNRTVYYCTQRAQIIEKYVLKSNSRNIEDEFMISELIDLKKLRHKNLVTLIDVFVENDNIHILSKYMDGRTLIEYLEKSSKLTILNRYEISLQIARGMNYLEDKNIIHRQLMTRNVIVHIITGNIKISGLWHSRIKSYNCHESERDDLSKFAAPEVLRNQEFSHKSDVWSFGVVLHNIFSDTEHLNHFQASNDINYKWLHKGHRLLKPCYADDDIYSVMAKCWSWKDADRPSFRKILEFLIYLSEK
ncbi:tyrosine-protein kinase Src64B-like [Ctenocephalides felis]|uniref:tyrosine-protein kinase Src64B-like n=1 Tax=Ctenocephalides felis TaxID=7515 RepID=UPI000E6E49E4|nr:tyrosine-protein kinase Src64B-like [Ctenocephalides felis]